MTLDGRPVISNPSHPGRRWRSAVVVVAAVVLCAGAVAALLALPAVIVPANAVPDAATRLRLQNEYRTTVLQGIGGLVVVLGAYFTWRQLQVSRGQLRHSLDSAMAQLQLGTRTQVNEQLSRSIGQLGHDRAGVRLGAVFALEQIARTSVDVRAGIHELLAGYVRSESPWSGHDRATLVALEPEFAPGDPPELPLLKVRAPDVQAALTVLGRRLEVPGEAIELQSTDLRACYLGQAALRGAFLGRAMLAGSDLTGCKLSGAWLRRANLRGVAASGADFRGAVLRDAILRGADLTGADLRGADLSNADLTEATLEGVRVDEATAWPDGFDRQP
ncbi:pentapeptide repeat-containing protein [Amycolatopsis sp. NPDC049691]|uniref:pentapeptide repeat-containing protein n=1 Tax=Amycolatopsis sp. NPDC049691 TaxID=3155155 RepID=UPI00343D3B85